MRLTYLPGLDYFSQSADGGILAQMHTWYVPALTTHVRALSGMLIAAEHEQAHPPYPRKAFPDGASHLSSHPYHVRDPNVAFRAGYGRASRSRRQTSCSSSNSRCVMRRVHPHRVRSPRVPEQISGENNHLFGDGMAIWITKDRAQPGPVFGSKGRPGPTPSSFIMSHPIYSLQTTLRALASSSTRTLHLAHVCMRVHGELMALPTGTRTRGTHTRSRASPPCSATARPRTTTITTARTTASAHARYVPDNPVPHIRAKKGRIRN